MIPAEAEPVPADEIIDVASLCDARLESNIAEMAAHLSAGTARFLQLVGEFDRRESWAPWGMASTAQWLGWRCGLSPVAAREHVRVARALRRLPRLHGAFCRGELSYSKVRALTRIASMVTEDLLLEWACHGTAVQIERLVRGVRLARAHADPGRRRRRRTLEHFYDDEGCLVIRARLDPEDGVVVLAALEEAARRLEAEDPSERLVSVPAGTPETAGDAPAEVSQDPADWEEDPLDLEASTPQQQRRADALTRVAQEYVDRSSSSGAISLSERALIVVHVDPATLSDRRCELAGGPPLSAETARRLACDAGVVRMIGGPGGTPLSVGRRSRTVPRPMRRRLERRDRACRFPGCPSRRSLDAHHVRHWAHGGETSLDNLLMLCRRHHRLVHEGGFTIARDAGGTTGFLRPDGQPVRAAPPASDPAGIARANARRGVAIDPTTCASRWDGVHPDYGLAVEVFLDADRRPSLAPG